MLVLAASQGGGAVWEPAGGGGGAEREPAGDDGVATAGCACRLAEARRGRAS